MSYNDLRRGRVSISGQEYYVTTVVSRRRSVFLDFPSARLCIEALKVSEQHHTGCIWLAWVLMPDHFHGLLSLGPGHDISRVLSGFKGRSARWVNRHEETYGRLWQPGFWDRALRKEEDRLAVARYIVANPLRKGLVRSLKDYPHWDSVWI